MTASFNMARATVLPGTPMAASPMLWKISPTLSPNIGRGGQGEVNDTETDTQPLGHLPADEFADASDFIGGIFYDIAQLP